MLKPNFNEDDIDANMLKRLKNTKTQQSLATIFARKCSDIEIPTKI